MEWWEIALIIVAIIALIVVLITIWFISTLNTLKRMVIKVEESESSIDVALTKRYDVLTKLLDATKGFIKHEEKLITEITKLRLPAHGASIEEKSAFAHDLAKGYAKINVVAENYPTLKSDGVFMKLQDASSEVEENLQAARRFYNSNVSIYNQKIAVWPSSIVANKQNYHRKTFFEAEEAKRADVKIDFGE